MDDQWGKTGLVEPIQYTLQVVKLSFDNWVLSLMFTPEGLLLHNSIGMPRPAQWVSQTFSHMLEQMWTMSCWWTLFTASCELPDHQTIAENRANTEIPLIIKHTLITSSSWFLCPKLDVHRSNAYGHAQRGGWLPSDSSQRSFALRER